MELGRYEEAIKDFTQTLRLESNTAEAHLYRAESLLCLSRYDEAEVDFNEAVRRKIMLHISILPSTNITRTGRVSASSTTATPGRAARR